MEARLVQRFSNLLDKLGAREEFNQRWTGDFVTKYTEPQRHYHTLFHIDAMFACLDSRNAVIANADALALAIFFHDWIYDPTKADNELQSMHVLQRFARDLALDPLLRDKVNSYIERTITHTLPENSGGDQDDPDLLLFLDADLEVLSRNPPQYDLYARQIRKEYAHYSVEDYCLGRAKILHKFLGRDRIYFSDAFAAKEDIARQNIRRDITQLEARKLV